MQTRAHSGGQEPRVGQRGCGLHIPQPTSTHGNTQGYCTTNALWVCIPDNPVSTGGVYLSLTFHYRVAHRRDSFGCTRWCLGGRGGGGTLRVLGRQLPPPPPPGGLRPTVSWGVGWRPEPRGRPPPPHGWCISHDGMGDTVPATATQSLHQTTHALDSRIVAENFHMNDCCMCITSDQWHTSTVSQKSGLSCQQHSALGVHPWSGYLSRGCLGDEPECVCGGGAGGGGGGWHKALVVGGGGGRDCKRMMDVKRCRRRSGSSGGGGGGTRTHTLPNPLPRLRVAKMWRRSGPHLTPTWRRKFVPAYNRG